MKDPRNLRMAILLSAVVAAGLFLLPREKSQAPALEQPVASKMSPAPGSSSPSEPATIPSLPPGQNPSAAAPAPSPADPTASSPPGVMASSPKPASSGGPLPPAALQIADGGTLRSFELALNEIWVSDRDGAGRLMPVSAASEEELETILLAAGGDAAAVLYQQGAPRSSATRRILSRNITVKTADSTDPASLPGTSLVEQPSYAPGYAVLAAGPGLEPLRAAHRLRAAAGVESADVQLARQQSKKAMPNDTLIGRQWHLKVSAQTGALTGTDINVESVWAYPAATGIRGNGVRIGIVDDGLQTGHPDLAPNVDTVNDYDWNGGDGNPEPSAANQDYHGTSCAGNAAARGNNTLGVSGSAPEATLVGMRLIATGSTDSTESQAMAYLPDLIQIKSNSWGPADDGLTLEGPGSLTAAALKSAAETGRGGRGTIFLWAGGNGLEESDNSNYDGYANSIYTIAVAALDSQSRQAYYSESGANIVVSAPSNGNAPALGITTTDLVGTTGYNSGSTSGELSDANYTQTFGGTSSATPTAAGVVALMLQANPALGWRDVQDVLIRSAKQVNPSDSDWATNGAGLKFNHKFGAGLIDAAAAVALAQSSPRLSAQQSAAVSSNTTSSIPDNSTTGVTRTFTFTSSPVKRVEHVTVRLNVTGVPKGQLEVTLTSPSGMVSRLSEKGIDTTNFYTNWTFMTVRNWGEDPAGTWTLRVADRTAGTTGTLTSATITVFGSDGIPLNPPPVVTLWSPANGQTFASGTPVSLQATATDVTANGANGTVSGVEFLQGTTIIGSDSSAPYTLSWTPPADGSYALSARATDSEGATGTSSSVTITSGNPPAEVFAEDFVSITSGNSAATDGSSLSWTGNTNFPTVSNAFEAGGAVRLGSRNATGSMTSRMLNLSGSGGNFTVSFDVKGWSTVEGNITVSITGLPSRTVSYNAVISGAFESKSVTFSGGSANSTLTIGTTARRAFIDNVTVTFPAAQAPSVTTGSVSAITSSSATLSGNITSIGSGNASERGFFWSTTSGFANGTGTKVSSNGNFTAEAFTATVSGLSPATQIYFKAFATNAAGTTYGLQSTFTTAPPTFAQWIASRPGLADTSAGGNPDGDAAPNLVEYFMGLNPTLADTASAFVAGSADGNVSLTYYKSKSLNGVSGSVQWSSTLGANASWSSSGVSDVLVSDQGSYEIRRASTTLAPGETAKFLQLRVTTP